MTEAEARASLPPSATDSMESVFGFLAGLPPAVAYLVLGVGAALENVVPPIPADTFVLLGGFLAGRGLLGAWSVFLTTWGANVLSALAVYWAGHRHGRPFFREGLGRHIVTRHQLQRLGRFYERWGILAIFFTRFLPGLRAVVPAFAGVTHQSFLPVAIPLALASAIWYGALVWIGATTARNWETMLGWLGDANRVLLALAVLAAAAIGVWWWRSRHGGKGGGEKGHGREGRDRGTGGRGREEV